MGRKKKQFCPHGHDTFQVGRHSNGTCRVCTDAYARKWAEEHREFVNRQARARTAAHPDRARKATMDWRERHPQRYERYLRRWMAQWRRENRAHIREYDRKRYWENHSFLLQRNRARSQRRPPMSREDTEAILSYYGRQCVYCGAPATGFDHLHPLARGGGHTIENQAPACIDCNRRKSNRPIWVMLEYENGARS